MRSDFFKRMAVDMAVDREVVESVVHHSLEQLTKKSKECKSLEISGWGTFILREKGIPEYVRKFEKKIEKLKVRLGELQRPGAIRKMEERIRNAEKGLAEIKKRYGMEENL